MSSSPLIKPLIVIEPGRDTVISGMREVWEYRDLIHLLVLRDVKVRYKQTLLGAGWALLQPLLAMCILTIIFARLAEPLTTGVPYPLFVIAGLLPWTFFSNAVTSSGGSVLASASLITKVYFPRIVIPTASVIASLLELVIGLVLLAAMLAWYRIAPTPNLLLLFPLTLMIAMLASGVGLWVAALNVRFRDFRYALPFLIQMWFLATPIIVPATVVPDSWRRWLWLNPMAGLVQGFRAACFGTTFDLEALGASVAITLALLACGVRVFRALERSFADVI